MNIISISASMLLSTGIWFYFINKKDKVEREPLLTVIYVGLLGGFISTFFAGIFNNIFEQLLGASNLARPLPVLKATALSLFVGVNEESLKCLAAVLLIRKLKEFDEPVDGIIYAMMVSLGFAAIENISYIYRHGLSVLIGRTLLSVPAHLGFGALWGTGLAIAKFKSPDKNILFVTAPYLASAALFHALFDFVLFVSLPFKGLIITMIVISLWFYASRKADFLVAHSPFLKKNQGPEYGEINNVPSGEFPHQPDLE